MTTPATDTRDILHPFERAGLGVAPFALTACRENWYVACQGADRQPGGTCDFCLTGIAHEFHIKSSDGKTFKVGCDCVMKLGRDDNRLVSQVERIVLARKREAAKANTAKRKASKTERVKAAIDRLANDIDLQSSLANQPHPKGFTGLTLLDYCGWMIENAGLTGKFTVATIIEKNAANLETVTV